jgi:alpha-beta hydrolase superfamily lysophospholipase
MVRREEGFFGAADGRRVFHRRWLPGGASRAAVVIIHGYAEHAGRYDWTGERLADAGYAAYALDLIGHGQSEGPRVLVKSMNEFLDDVRAFVAIVRQREPGKPLFLLGHSMGGAITTLYLGMDKPDVRGTVLSGAVLATNDRGPDVRERLVRAIGRVFPRLPIATLKSASVSRDPAVVEAYDRDPLVYRGRMKAGLLAAMARGVRRADEAAPGITSPLLILHAGDDELTSPNGSQRLYERVASTDRTLKIYEGLFHEILNEPERDVVIGDIIDWLNARV